MMDKYRNMFARIASAIVFFVFFLLGLFQEKFVFVLPMLVTFATLAGVREALKFGGGHLPRLYTGLALCASIAMLADAYFFTFDHILMILAVLTVIAMGAGVFQREGNQMAMSGQCVTATIYVAFPLALLVYIWQQAVHNLSDSAEHYLIFLLFATWPGDIGAYFAGRAFGRHKLAPKLSPGKTIEGLIGGILFTILVVVAMYLSWNNIRNIFNIYEVVGLGVVFSIIGPLGDLAESRLKRSAGIKDSGATFTGHGGMLDIIDSLLFTTPVYYCYLSLVHPALF